MRKPKVEILEGKIGIRIGKYDVLAYSLPKKGIYVELWRKVGKNWVLQDSGKSEGKP